MSKPESVERKLGNVENSIVAPTTAIPKDNSLSANPASYEDYPADELAEAKRIYISGLNDTNQQITELEAKRDQLHNAIIDGRFPNGTPTGRERQPKTLYAAFEDWWKANDYLHLCHRVAEAAYVQGRADQSKLFAGREQQGVAELLREGARDYATCAARILGTGNDSDVELDLAGNYEAKAEVLREYADRIDAFQLASNLAEREHVAALVSVAQEVLNAWPIGSDKLCAALRAALVPFKTER